MLNNILIKGFKCFGDSQIKLSSLTLLCGLNAAGKSTTVQPLLLLADTLRSNSAARSLTLNGSMVRLGSPGEILHDGSTDNDITFGVGTRDDALQWKFSIDDVSRRSLLRLKMVSRTSADGESQSVDIDSTENISSLLPKQFQDIKSTDIIEAVRNVVYVGAIRTPISDVFPAPESIELIRADVGIQGEFAPWWFDNCADEDIDQTRMHPGEKSRLFRRQLNAWLSAVFAGAEANVQRVRDTNLVRLELRVGNKEWRRPANIGFGLSYSFPVITACLLATKGQILVIDSPEAHLHPKGQSAMGRFLSQVAASGVQLIVETHSDHVVNGVRLGVASSVLPKDDLAMKYFAGVRKNGVADIMSIDCDSNGRLNSWPEGFFDQIEKDLSQL